MKKFVFSLLAILCWATGWARSYQKLMPGPLTSFMVVDLGFLAKQESGLYQILGCQPMPVSAESGYWQIYDDTT